MVVMATTARTRTKESRYSVNSRQTRVIVDRIIVLRIGGIIHGGSWCGAIACQITFRIRRQSCTHVSLLAAIPGNCRGRRRDCRTGPRIILTGPNTQGSRTGSSRGRGWVVIVAIGLVISKQRDRVSRRGGGQVCGHVLRETMHLVQSMRQKQHTEKIQDCKSVLVHLTKVREMYAENQ